MGKRTPAQKKGKGKGGADAISAEALEHEAFESLRQGRFKDAAEQFKRLVKREARPAWEQALSDAYVGRARALADKGMAAEAAIVLENTANAAGGVREPLLYLACLLEAGKTEKAVQATLTALATAETADSNLADRETAESVTGLATVLLLTQAGAKITGAKPALVPPALAAPLKAAQAAVSAWLGGDRAGLETALRGIPLGSPWKALRLVLKGGLGAEGDGEKQRQLLDRIPADDPWRPLRDTLAAALCSDGPGRLERWRGLASEQRALLADLGALPSGAARSVDALLSAEARGTEVLLTHLLKQAGTLPSADLRAAVLELLPDAPNRLDEAGRVLGGFTDVERLWVRALAEERRHRWGDAGRLWDELRDQLNRDETDRPADRALDAMLCRHLADLAWRVAQAQGPARASEADAMADYLCLAIEADPDDAETVRKLIDRHREMGRQKAWHALAEAQADRFPEDTTLLLHAVEAAADRKAFRKAAGYARRLLERDPINQTARQRMIDLQLAHARKKIKEGRLDLAEQALAEGAQWESAGAPNLSLRVGQALLLIARKRGDEGMARLEDAVRRAALPVLGWFQVALEARLMGMSATVLKTVDAALIRATRTAPTPAEVLAAVAFLDRPEIKAHQKVAVGPLRMVEGWLLKAAHRTISTADMHRLADGLRALGMYKLLGTFADAAHRRAPTEPAFGFYKIVARLKDDAEKATGMDMDQLSALIERAREQDDVQTSGRISRFVYRIESRYHDEPDLPGALDDMFQELRSFVDDLRDDVPDMLEALGRRGTLRSLMETLKRSPLGKLMPQEVLRMIAENLIDRAYDDDGSPPADLPRLPVPFGESLP